MGSSTKVSSGEAIASPTRSAKGERPLSTASPLSIPPTSPSTVAVIRGSSTRVSRWVAGLAEPSRRVDAQHRVVGRLVDRQVGDLASHRQPAGDLRLAVLLGERLHHEVARAGAPPGADAGAGGDGALAERIAVHRHADAAHPGITALGGGLELEGHRHLVGGGDGRQALGPEVELGGLHAVGRGEAVELVGLAELGVVARLGQRLQHHRLVEGARVGEALPVVDDHAHADTGRAGLREALDLAAVGLHRRAGAAGDVGLDLLAGLSPLGDAGGDVEQLRVGRARH